MLNEFVKYFNKLNKLTPSISPIGMASGMMPIGDEPKNPKGATYKTQAEVDADNAFARDYTSRNNELYAKTAYVAKKPGDPRVAWTNGLTGQAWNPQTDVRQMPASMIKNSVPDWVDKLEWDNEWQMPYYKDGNDMVFVKKEFYNSPRFIKPTK